MKTLLFILFVAALFIQSSVGMAFEGIVRPYQSVRSSGMGGIRLLTCLYEDCFYSNPARVTANPAWRVNLLDPTVEINTHVPSTIGDLVGNSNASTFASSAGQNNHGRFQMTFPSFFIPAGDLSFAVGVITSIQADVELSKNFNATTKALADVGAAFTVGYKGLLEDHSLSIGSTLHFAYRATGRPETSVADVLRDPSKIISASDAKRGGTIDFDIGATYVLPYKIDEIDFTVGASINNLFGGRYDRWAVGTVTDTTTGTPINNPPQAQPRALGFGLAVHQPVQWIFSDPVLALEFQDIGNNPDGSMFKTVHIGYELHYGVLAPRVGINQGYFTAGLGVNIPVLQIDLSTYGEEATLNVGGAQDRRFALRLGFHI